MNTKNNRRSLATISAIQNAYLSLISINQEKQITVRQICLKAGINRATFYAHFLDIYDLSDTIQDQMLKKMKQIFENHPTASTDLLESFTKLFDFIKSNQSFYYYYFVISSKTAKLDITTQEPFADYINRMKLSSDSDKDWQQEYRINFFNSGIAAIIKKWLKDGCLHKPEQMAEMIVDRIRFGRS